MKNETQVPFWKLLLVLLACLFCLVLFLAFLATACFLIMFWNFRGNW